MALKLSSQIFLNGILSNESKATISAAVPQKNTASAPCISWGVNNFSSTGIFNSLHISKTVALVIPGKIFPLGAVYKTSLFS